MSSEAGRAAAAIVLEGIGKEYRLGQNVSGTRTYRSARDELMTALRRVGRARDEQDDRAFWALRNVSFSVHAGERVGIIGRNGAGKSTLLKILSRITAPTEGRAEVRGVVGSLLEVGTGFHPELSGRDNLFLSGAILGMPRRELVEKLDQIVEFAGVERFLDTPVKRYSTGMYLRLAFAVAAHLDPDILLVDEVLAVGDAQFQKKCLGRMEELGGSGRTIVFVSHSMPSVLRLCDRVVLLDDGGVVADGSPQEVIRAYLDSGVGSPCERVWPSVERAPGDDVARLRSVRVRTDAGTSIEEIDIRRSVYVDVEYWHLAEDPSVRPAVSIHFVNDDGVVLFVSSDFNDRGWWRTPRRPGVIRSTCRVPGNFLAEGRIFVLAGICTYNPSAIHALVPDAVSFQVVDRSTGDGVRGEYVNDWPGVVRPMLDWSVGRVHDDDAAALDLPAS